MSEKPYVIFKVLDKVVQMSEQLFDLQLNKYFENIVSLSLPLIKN